MSFFEDLKKDLLEAIEIESGTVSLEECKGMPAKTYYVADEHKRMAQKCQNKELE
ncbi:MAG: hypothetical protein LIP10_06385 [Clostridiales bacterium]|nr:hypothetical protein [Clostridiales bacterium]